MPDIVFDSCAISNFALSGSMAIIESLCRSHAFITDFVMAEIWRGIQSGHSKLEGIAGAVRAGWLSETGLNSRAERRMMESLSQSLGLGEASSIAVAKHRGWVFASDDRVARAEANRLGIGVTGKIGILVKAVRTETCALSEAEVVLEKMIKGGFFSPVRSIRKLV